MGKSLVTKQSINKSILAGWDQDRNTCFSVRHLTTAEIAHDHSLRPQYFRAANCFMLFKLLELNFREWTNYQRALLTPGFNDGTYHIVLNRLLFNFLAAAYGVTEHFQTAYKHHYRKNQVMLNQYQTFVKEMCENTWAVAFFMDMRNFVQHCGLPVGYITRNEDEHSISISIRHHASDLLREYNQWARSKLSVDHGELDFIELTRDYYHILSHDYGSFMAKAFYPALNSIHAFYASLTQEVHQRQPASRMVFITEVEMESDGTLASLKRTTQHPPNDVFGELGIQVTKQ
jgi:hypothetical protein